MTVVDLGAAPGSWSQVLRERLGPTGKIVAIDLLPMDGIAGVVFVQGDFREADGLRALEAALGASRADLVVSDMAPNLSGIDAADQARSVHLGELALEFAVGHFASGRGFTGQGVPGRGIGGVSARNGRTFHQSLCPQAQIVARPQPGDVSRGQGLHGG